MVHRVVHFLCRFVCIVFFFIVSALQYVHFFVALLFLLFRVCVAATTAASRIRISWIKSELRDKKETNATCPAGRFQPLGAKNAKNTLESISVFCFGICYDLLRHKCRLSYLISLSIGIVYKCDIYLFF